MTETRYERNIPALEEQEQKLLSSRRVLVIGCGGLGGFILESLARLGVGHITAVDGDVFEESNLNRQLYSSPALLGQKKQRWLPGGYRKLRLMWKFLTLMRFFAKKMPTNWLPDRIW